MNSSFWKKALPHLVAIMIFLVVAMVYCKPALEGKMLSQTDVIGHTGMARQSEVFKEKYGHYPFWTESIFSGMPAYTVAFPSSATIVNHLVPFMYWFGGFNPIILLFLASVCFYLLTQVMRVNPWIGVLAALAYAYSTFDPIIIAVGHNTQMAAIGFMPAAVAGLILILRKKYLSGAALLAISIGLQATVTQHVQIIYYTLIIFGIIGIAFLVKSWKEKSISDAFIAGAIAIVATAIGFCTNAVSFLPLQEYAKETMRGGKSQLTTNGKNKSQGGLDKDYAFTWSYGIPETMTLYIPGIYGGGTAGKNLSENSKLAEKLQEIGYPEANALQNANYLSYWGDQGGEQIRTSGPVYLGAVICFLFVLGLVYVEGWNKWWIVSATIFGILLAWGKHFSTINYFLFDHLPFYNKFRSPTMSLVIPQLTVPLLAALGLDQVLTSKASKEENWKKFKTAVFVTAGLALLGILFYFMADFKGPYDAGMKQQISSGALQQLSRGKQPTPEIQQQASELGNSVVKALQSDRQSLMGSDLLRTIVFMALAVGLVGLYLKDKIKPVILLAGLIIISSYDLLAYGRKYLSEDNFNEAADVESVYTASAADQKILNDPDKNFRVFDLTDQQNGPFNSARASYFFNSIGGYHPAKLGLYQDIIENQISKQNISVLNMLNTRYFIQPNPSNGQAVATRNPGAFGPCWLVKSVHFVNTADEEMKALDSINLRDTAIVQKSFEPIVKFMPVPDSSASIKLIENLNDVIRYQSSSKTNQFAVFSEVYYDKGWNAYLDGAKTPYCKVDYVLRGMPLPAGDHRIEFRFEPTTFHTGETISWIASIVVYLILLGALWQTWKDSKKKTA
jgi:hypothetical protein